MHLSSEWQRNKCVMAYKRDTFKTNVSYSVPLKILLDYFEEQACPDGSGAQGTAALSFHTCCSPYSQPHARRAVAQLHGFPIHAVTASRLDICTENSKHLDLEQYFICIVFHTNSTKSTVFAANLR